MQEILQKSLKLIEMMEKGKISVREFIQNHAEYFSGMRTGTLIAPECRNIQEYSEKAYIFLIGSYIYYLLENKAVTWFERRRFAKFLHYQELFQRTLCSDYRRRFSSLSELKNYLNFLEKSNEKNSSLLSLRRNI